MAAVSPAESPLAIITSANFTQVELTTYVKTVAAYLVLTMAVSVCGNGALLATVLCNSAVRTRSNLFISNMALIHLLTALLSTPVSLATLLFHVSTAAFCKINLFIVLTFQGAISHSLMYFSIHVVVTLKRSCAVKALSSTNHVTPNSATAAAAAAPGNAGGGGATQLPPSSLTKVCAMVLCAWLFGCVGGLGPVLEYQETFINEGVSCESWHSSHHIIPLFHTYFLTIGSYLIPAMVISLNLMRIYCCMVSSPTLRALLRSSSSHMNYLKSVTTFTLLFILFLFSWMPYFAYAISASTGLYPLDWLVPNVPDVVYCFIYLQCSCFPVIVFTNSRGFRRGFSHTVCHTKSSYLQCDQSPVPQPNYLQTRLQDDDEVRLDGVTMGGKRSSNHANSVTNHVNSSHNHVGNHVQREIFYKDPSKLRLADFERLPAVRPFNAIQEEDETIEEDIVIQDNQVTVIDSCCEIDKPKPFSYFRSQAALNNLEGNESTYICAKNFTNPAKIDSGPFNDSLLIGGRLRRPELKTSNSSQSLSTVLRPDSRLSNHERHRRRYSNSSYRLNNQSHHSPFKTQRDSFAMHSHRPRGVGNSFDISESHGSYYNQSIDLTDETGAFSFGCYNGSGGGGSYTRRMNGNLKFLGSGSGRFHSVEEDPAADNRETYL